MPTWSRAEIDYASHEQAFGRDHFLSLKGKVDRGYVPAAFRLKRKVQRMLGADAGNYNHLDEFYCPEWPGELRTLQDRHRFDAVIVEYVLHSKCFTAFPDKVMKILDAHDTFVDRHKAFKNAVNPLGYWYSIPNAQQVIGFRRADVVLAIQEEEARSFAQSLGQGQPEVVTVGHLVDMHAMEGYASPEVVFLGSGNDANVDAVNHFLTRIYPLVREQSPSFRLALAGGICDHVEDHLGLRKLGPFNSILDVLRQAPIAINPMLVGTGLAIKLLEAMAAGAPAISTQTGARGLPEAYRQGVWVLEDDDDAGFANAVLELSASQFDRRRLGRAGHLAAARWNQDQIIQLERVLAERSV
nr:glycosyltransferase family 4 protein [Devosia ureilytica]